MSRVSDAMRRAGQLPDEQGEVRAGDNPFTTADDSRTDYASSATPAPVAYVAAQSEPESAQVGRSPGQAERAIIEGARGDSGEDVKISDLVGAVYRRRWLIAGVVLASVGLAAVYNRIATPLYEARARLLLEPTSPEVVPFRGTTEDQGRLDYFVTQLEVLRSRGLAQRTIEQLHLSKDPMLKSATIGDLTGGLTVAPVTSAMGESRVINVTVRSGNPTLAAKLANGLVGAYVDQNLEGRRQGSRDAAAWLNQRLVELRQQLEKSEGALQKYREQKDSVSLGDQQNIVVQKLTQLSAAVTTARTERVTKQTVYQQLQAIQNSGAPLDTFSPIQSNPFIQGLKVELASLQREKRQLGEQLGDLHPDMIKVNTAIANAERRLNEEMAKVVEGVQNEYRAAQANEQGLTAALEEQKREVLNLNQQSIEYGALQRDSSSTQQMFQTVLQRVKETEISGELQSNNAKILDAAEVPRSPISPRKYLNLIIALVGGGFIAVGLALGVENLNPRMVKPSDISDALRLPLLGVAPRIRRLKSGSGAAAAFSPAYQEALRAIRTQIFLSPIAATARSMVVTSTNPGEGKTMVASNLAVSMAAAGRRVLLVDADLRRPQLHRIFSIAKSPGLSDVIADEVKPSDALLESSTPGLFILPAGGEVSSPTDLLDSERLQQLIQGFSQIFDVIVLDCPPVLAVADATILANAASSVLFVVGAGSTNREAARVAIERLLSVQAQVVGVVLNNAKLDPQSEYGYSGYLSDSINRSTAARKSLTEHA